MMRKVLAVALGFSLWSLLWVGVNAGLRAGAPDFPDGDYFDATLILALLLTLSVICSIAAGALTASLAPGGAVLVLAMLLLLTGIGVQASAWEQMPLWYHLGFLALLVPVTLIGGRLRG